MTLYDPGRILWAEADRSSARLAVFGAPFDATTSYRPGTRFGPPGVRAATRGLELYSPRQGLHVRASEIADLGDLELPFGGTETALASIGELSEALFAEGRLPFLLGGEHLVSLPAILAASHHHPDLHVIQFDAHTDLRETYAGERLSHATFLYHVGREIGFSHIHQFGIRSGEREEFELGTDLHSDLDVASLGQALAGKPVYVTLDIDVLDPAFAPGTGTPEPGGATFRELYEALLLLRGLRIVGADLVEVAPGLDAGGQTAVCGAKLMREMHILMLRGDGR